MYKFDDGQRSIDEFRQPLGMHLSESNRWVKKTRLIPWLQIEKRYAQLFRNRNENVAKPLRLTLGACFTQGEYKFSDVEVALQISIIFCLPWVKFRKISLIKLKIKKLKHS